MRVTLLLADAAQIADGKLYMIGGGWSFTSPEIGGHALCGIIEMEPDELRKDHQHWMVRLLDDDGQLVLMKTPTDELPILVEGDLTTTGPTPDVPTVRIPLAISFGPLTLEGGKTYAWELILNDVSRPDWRISFTTRDA